MSQQLWLLRHGEAESHDARPDFERRLTTRGEDQSRAAGAALAALELRFSAIFASPRVRALDTARLVAEALDGEPVVHGPLSGGFAHADAVELLAGYGGDDRLLLVGHDPDLSQLVHDITGARAQMKKGGVAGMRLASAHGELIALLRPRELARLAG